MKRLLLITCCLFTGCASVPQYQVVYPEGKTTEDAKRDYYECKLESRAVLPGHQVPAAPPNSGFIGGFSQGYSQGQARSRVVYDEGLIHDCLTARGYRWIPVQSK